jgi:catechol 2,3-dioxygenase
VVQARRVAHDLGATIEPDARLGVLNHIAYALELRQEVLLAADAAVEAGETIELGAGEAWGRESFLYVREPATQQRIELYSGGYLNFELDRPTIVWWWVTNTSLPLLAWGGEIPASFGGAHPVPSATT